MNALDIIILLLLVPAAVAGFSSGFVRQVSSLLALILGVWLAFRLSSAVSVWLAGLVSASPAVLNIISFVVILLAVAILLHLIGAALTKLLKIIMLGWLNRLLGVVFALLKALLLLGVLVLLFDSINSRFELVSEDFLGKSLLYGLLRDGANALFPYLKTLVLPSGN